MDISIPVSRGGIPSEALSYFIYGGETLEVSIPTNVLPSNLTESRKGCGLWLKCGARSEGTRGKGLPYMTSWVGGGGTPRSRQKEQNQLIWDSDRGRGGKKVRKFCGHHIWKPPKEERGGSTPRCIYPHLPETYFLFLIYSRTTSLRPTLSKYNTNCSLSDYFNPISCRSGGQHSSVSKLIGRHYSGMGDVAVPGGDAECRAGFGITLGLACAAHSARYSSSCATFCIPTCTR